MVSTVNGGATWNSQNLPSSGAPISAIDCPSTTTCYATGYAYTDNDEYYGDVVATTDGGGSWVIQAVSTSYALDGVACVSVTSCHVIGYDISGSGLMLSTTNGGGTWKDQVLPSGVVPLFGIACRTSGVCFAVTSPPTTDSELLGYLKAT
jgi:photosystem II stability/assembly factor-like uncharacterized protein